MHPLNIFDTFICLKETIQTKKVKNIFHFSLIFKGTQLFNCKPGGGIWYRICQIKRIQPRRREASKHCKYLIPKRIAKRSGNPLAMSPIHRKCRRCVSFCRFRYDRVADLTPTSRGSGCGDTLYTIQCGSIYHD